MATHQRIEANFDEFARQQIKLHWRKAGKTIISIFSYYFHIRKNIAINVNDISLIIKAISKNQDAGLIGSFWRYCIESPDLYNTLILYILISSCIESTLRKNI